MGVLNVTPDSFSDGGRFLSPADAIAQAQHMIEAGADIIDIGGGSTRAGAAPVGEEDEPARHLPGIGHLACRGKPIHDATHRPGTAPAGGARGPPDRLGILRAVGTYRSGTARAAGAAGAHIGNDVWGLQRDPAIATVAAETGAGLVIMHTGRERVKLPDVIEDQFHFLERSLEIAA